MNKSGTGGLSFLSALQIAFIVLKLTGFIHWSWLWVLSPIWLPVMILGMLFVVFIMLEGRKRGIASDLLLLDSCLVAVGVADPHQARQLIATLANMEKVEALRQAMNTRSRFIEFVMPRSTYIA